jgi:hypothetical protein
MKPDDYEKEHKKNKKSPKHAREIANPTGVISRFFSILEMRRCGDLSWWQ